MMDRMIHVGLLAGLLAGAWGGGGWAQRLPTDSREGRRPMTFADLERIKRVSDPQISPSGKWVMFSVAEVDLE